jgi:predicted DNA-binding transcriptional regulator AlpA
VLAGVPAQQVYLSDRDLGTRFGVDRNSVWRWAKIGAFPQPIKFVGSSRWRLEDVVAWEAEQLAKSMGK